jgi:hypothetical protein
MYLEKYEISKVETENFKIAVKYNKYIVYRRLKRENGIFKRKKCEEYLLHLNRCSSHSTS